MVQIRMDLKEFLKQNWGKGDFIQISLNREIRSKIENQTQFLNQYYDEIPLRTRAYVIVNTITELTIPKCKCGCGKVSAINKTRSEQGFREYSGSKCSRKSKTIGKDVLKILDNYEFLYHEKIEKQKSIEQIASELKISITPVVKYLKKHNLYQLNDARRRNTRANELLSDKNKLLELYDTNNLQDIAKSIGTTKATVSKWFKIHQIQTKPSNSYERKIKRISNEESELFKFLNEIYSGEIQQSNRSILNGKELDIYIPEKKLAIEYNGLYSHLYRPWESKESLIKGSKYHLTKTIECESKGIQLLQFYSDEWKLKRTIVQNILKSKLNLNSRIYARNCTVSKIDTYIKNAFLNEYHIQGEDKSSIKLGLFCENELVSIMTFSKSRFNKSYNWELTRFCVKGGVTVIGGFSKLLSHFRKKYEGSIISYADRRYSDGKVYFKNGFQLIATNSPSYYYVDKNCLRRVTRMHFQKKNIGAYNCTEYEKAREMGFEKIWDCGTLAYGLQ